MMSYLRNVILVLFLLLSYASFGQDIIYLDDKREIFVDNYLIEQIDGVNILMHHPYDEGPVFFFDKPWEGPFCGYVTIIKDMDTYKVYYRGSQGGRDGNDNEVTCYAESKDGIKWHKPNLGIHTIQGSKNNNVVLANIAPVPHNFSPFLDLNPKVHPDQRYKGLGGVDRTGLIAYISPDGINWKQLQPQAVFKKGVFDSQNVAFWSESEKCYVCYFRIWSDGGFTAYKGFRSVGRSTSTDFVNWSEPEAMTFGDTPLEHLYTQQTSPYFRAPHIYVAIGGRFMPGRQVLTEEQAKQLNVNPGYFKDCSDAFFMTSRGGTVYDRTFMEAFIRPGIGLDNWVSRSNYPALNVVQTSPTEMSIYVNQDYAQPTAHLHRYSLRLDGFTSLSASYRGGEILSKPLTFSGKELEINYSTSAAGELKFELQDMNGNPIPGYTMDDSDTIIGNEISRIVTWKENKNVGTLASKMVRLRIYMKDADLYSIRFK